LRYFALDNFTGAKMKNTKPQSKLHVRRYASEDENFWRHHIAACSESPVSRASYCKQNNVDYHRLGYWTRKLSSGQSESVNPTNLPISKSTPLIPVQLKPLIEQNNSAVLGSIHLNNGHVLHIHDQQALLMLLDRWV
jgi:hypothetical protein